MGLNETLERLAKEREAKDLQRDCKGTAKEEVNNSDFSNSSDEPTTQTDARKVLIRYYAERVFFGRMLKEVNHGLSERKLEAMIDRSVKIATLLCDKLNEV